MKDDTVTEYMTLFPFVIPFSLQNTKEISLSPFLALANFTYLFRVAGLEKGNKACPHPRFDLPPTFPSMAAFSSAEKLL